MVKIPNRGRKIYILKRAQNGLCACGCGRKLPNYSSFGDSLDLHHKLPDTAGNRAKYPDFIHSVFNLQAVLHSHHLGTCPSGGCLIHYTTMQADRLNKILLDWPEFAQWVNGKIDVINEGAFDGNPWDVLRYVEDFAASKITFDAY